ncbi:MAG: hypothetical protein WDW38_007920 [Sanguina aurantia]
MDLLETLGLGGKVAEENVVYYALYPDSSTSAGSSSSSLPALLSRCTQLLQTSLEGYIWQRDVLQLTPSTEQPPPWTRTRKQGNGRSSSSSSITQGGTDTQLPACLWGAVRFGDNVDDEWFIVYLLLQLSRSIPEISVQVWDNDGDFLLIEAAYALPRWLKPEVAGNRVWLRRGRVHIIPQPSAKHPTLPPFPSLAQALTILASHAVETASARVQAPISERLAEFPGKARASMHRARVLLPASLARVLQEEPQLVAAAVEAFSSRDAEGMKAASRMTHFPMTHDTAPALVTFSRCLYAQLAQQRFSAPKGLSLPPIGHPLHKAADLGLKVTAGFEILAYLGSRASQTWEPAAEGLTSTPVPGPAPLPLPDKSDPAWLSFLSALDTLGYFQGNIPGSAAHRALTATAMADFATASRATGSGSAAGRRADSVWERIQSILSRPPQGEGSATGAAEAEDDDGWMEAQGGSLDAEIARREEEVRQHASGSSRKAAADGGPQHQHAGVPSVDGDDGSGSDSGGEGQGGGSTQARVQEVDADALAPQLRGFIDYLQSGMEGAEAPGDRAGMASSSTPHPHSLSKPAQQHNTRATGGPPLNHPSVARNHPGGAGRAPAQAASSQRRAAGDTSSAGDVDVDLDPMLFFSELGRVLGMDLGSSLELGFEGLEGLGGSSWAADAEASERVARPAALAASSSEDEGGDEAAVSQRPARSSVAERVSRRRDVDTETDSDDDEGKDDESDDERDSQSESEGDGVEFVDRVPRSSRRARRSGGGSTFARAYDAALALELQGTKMAETFERLALPSAGTSGSGTAGGGLDQQGGKGGGGGGGSGSTAPVGGGNSGNQDDLQPVDLDLNLVKNLIRSYTSQQGMSGPASNLAGLLGLELPRGDIVD